VSSRYERALVTGASSGIGAAIARGYAARGVDLVLVARGEERLTALAEELQAEAGVGVEVLAADLTRDDGRAATEARIASRDEPVDVLVNNAGFVVDEELADSDVDDRIREVELNVVAVTRLASVAAHTFRAHGHGGICFVSSVTAFWPMPGQATYAAGKAFVLSLAEALHVEMEGTGVHVSAVCPGFTRTEIFERAGVDVGVVPSPLWLSGETVAEEAIEGLERNDTVVTPGSVWQAMRLASRLTPGPVLRRAAPIARRLGGPG
jgi:short-subunit dehydrogenase